MDMDLCGRNVFVTASTSGIGKAVATAFLEEGATVVINGRNKDKTNILLTKWREKYGMEKVYAVCADMSDEVSVKAAVKEMEGYVPYLDIVVGNLGTGKPVAEDKFDLKEWRYMLDVNLLSTVALIQNTRALFNKLGGSIVVMASLAAHDRIGAPPAYAAAKAALLSLVKYAAPLLIKQNIRINAVSPGNVFFKGGRWEELREENPEATKEYLQTEVPMQRFGMPEEIAKAVLFLSSEKSSFTTGTVLQVDGGQGKGY